ELLAGQLGTTVSGLRSLASQGKITGQVIADALIDNLEKVRGEAALMPATIADAWVRVQNVLTAFFGKLDKALGASGRFASKIIELADELGALGDRIIPAVVSALDGLAAHWDQISGVVAVLV